MPHPYYPSRGFTLVELIVVITILSILGTVGFISIKGYSASSRDATRGADVSLLAKTLDLYGIQAGSYPTPDTSLSVTYSGSTLWTQGDFASGALQKTRGILAGNSIDSVPSDPLNRGNYKYSVLAGGLSYQVANFFWEGDSPAANAGTGPYAKISGNYGGLAGAVQTGGTTYVIASPTIMTASGTTGSSLIVTALSGSLLTSGWASRDGAGIAYTPVVAWSGTCPTGDASSTYASIGNGVRTAYAGSTAASLSDVSSFLAWSNTSAQTIPLGAAIAKPICGSAQYSSNFTASDPDWPKVVFLMRMEGANNSTAFVEERGNAIQSVGGTAKISSSSAKFGIGGFSATTASSGIVTFTGATAKIGNNDFTIEAWIYPTWSTRIGNYPNIIDESSSWAPGAWALQYDRVDGANIVWFLANNNSINIKSSAVDLRNGWHHIAVSRNYGANWTRLYIDGVLAASGAGNYNLDNGGTYATNIWGAAWNGNIDDVRITRGLARYTADFTPPTEAFPNQ